MVISGGENIYPAEVESVLYDHPDIAEVAVIGAPDERWGERVVGVVAPKPGRTITLEGLQAFAETRLARYKLPKELRIVDALPRNPTGKVLKAKLREHNVPAGCEGRAPEDTDMAGPTRAFWQDTLRDRARRRGTAVRPGRNCSAGSREGAILGRPARAGARLRQRLGRGGAGGGGRDGHGHRLCGGGGRPHAGSGWPTARCRPRWCRPTCCTWSPAQPSTRSTSRPACARCTPTTGPPTPRNSRAWVRPGGTAVRAVHAGARCRRRADGFVTGPPYHCDIHAMRALFPSSRWSWPKPPYERVPHPLGAHELALVLTRL